MRGIFTCVAGPIGNDECGISGSGSEYELTYSPGPKVRSTRMVPAG